MTQTTKSKTTFDTSKGYKRTKTITYTLTEFVRPLKKKAVQMSFPFPEETKKDNGQPVISISKIRDNQPITESQ
jgi:hypothetical protein